MPCMLGITRLWCAEYFFYPPYDGFLAYIRALIALSLSFSIMLLYSLCFDIGLIVGDMYALSGLSRGLSILPSFVC